MTHRLPQEFRVGSAMEADLPSVSRSESDPAATERIVRTRRNNPDDSRGVVPVELDPVGIRDLVRDREDPRRRRVLPAADRNRERLDVVRRTGSEIVGDHVEAAFPQLQKKVGTTRKGEILIVGMMDSAWLAWTEGTRPVRRERAHADRQSGTRGDFVVNRSAPGQGREDAQNRGRA